MGLVDKLQAMDLDELFSYQTVKYVTIKDRKLGIIHHILQIVIFAYIVLYTIIYEQRYLLLEPPYGSIRATVKEPPKWIPAETLPYCYQNQTEHNNFQNYNCTYMRGTDIAYPPGQIESIFVSTRFKDTYYTQSSNCTNPESATTLECAPPETPSHTSRFYIAGIEKYTLYMEHAIFGRQNEILVANFDCDGEFMLRNGTKNPINFNYNRTGDIVDMQTIINAADIPSLDDPSGLGNSYRYDGVLIVAVITYTNYVTEPKKFKYTYQFYLMPKQDVISMQPSQVVPGGTMQRNWYGVHVIFMVVGSIGYFDFPTLLTSLVSGLVLIKLATVVVDMMLLYVLPAKQIYTKHKYEYPDDFERPQSVRPSSKTPQSVTLESNVTLPLLSDYAQ